MLKLSDAFADAEVLLGAVLAGNEKASGLGVVRVLADLERVEVSEFGLSLLVHLKELLDEVGVVSGELLAVLLEVEDCACLALYLVDVSVVYAGNFVAGALSLAALLVVTVAFLSLSRQLLLLLNVSQLGLDAELIVTALLLPEGLQFLAKSL